MPESLPELIAALDEVALAELLRSAMNDCGPTPTIRRPAPSSATRWRCGPTTASPSERRTGDLSTVARRPRTAIPGPRGSAARGVVGPARHGGSRATAEPFTTNRLATAITALWQGLVLRHAVDPDAVDDDLFGDLVSLLVISLSHARRTSPSAA